MANSAHLIQRHVSRVYEAKGVVEVHALAGELHELFSDMSVEQIIRAIGEHVAAIRGVAVWRWPDPSNEMEEKRSAMQ